MLALVSSVHADERVLFRLQGSNTIGADLAPALVKQWFAKRGYSDISYKVVGEQHTRVVAKANGKPVAVDIRSHGSSTAFKGLAAGETDIGMSSRPIKGSEFKKLVAAGRLDKDNGEFVVGLDGIAVIVNPGNPLKQLDKSVLRKIFSGEVSNWADVGGKSGNIHIYARDDKSGTFDTFKHLVLGKDAPLTGNALRFESNAELSDKVAADRNGIGFVSASDIRNARALAISDGVDLAIMPQSFFIATEDYALARRLFFYVPPVKEGSQIEEFAKYAISSAGQKVVEQNGFISQEVMVGEGLPRDKLPEEYRKLVVGAKRLSVSFRFTQGSAALDNKARQDMERLVDFLKQPANAKKDVLLFGFANGNAFLPMHSLALSEERATGVAQVLIHHGFGPTTVAGLASSVLLAGNTSEMAGEKNTRVEVWLR